MRTLVIVESPTKAKKISALLGRGYRVVATLGHIKDLPAKELGIDIHHNYMPKWVTVRGKTDIIRQIQELAREADRIIIATDPDREGEGIANHIMHLLTKEQQKKAKRAEFREITQSGVLAGLQHLRDLDVNTAMAQQARRIVDRLVGFEISPLLWKSVKGHPGLSAGRVQSAALKLLYDRYCDVVAFQQKEYWTIEGIFQGEGKAPFRAALTQFDQVDLGKGPIQTREEAKSLLYHLERLTYRIGLKQREKKEYGGPPPLITTTLLSAANTQLGISAKKAMLLCQELFEDGLITYMRTDSPRVSPEAANQARQEIIKTWGPEFAPAQMRSYGGQEGAQDAHECIRPTQISVKPEELLKQLNEEQLAVYGLIYRRFLMSQMANSIHDETTIKVMGEGYGHHAIFHAFSSRVLFPGWRVLAAKQEEEGQREIEDLVENEPVQVVHLTDHKHLTKPPAHYTEATLIKKLEALGIGRPSTYSAIISTLTARKYIETRTKKLIITPLGITVVEALGQIFPKILSSKFTAEMEARLDDVADGEVSWVKVADDLYKLIEQVK